MTTDRPGTRIDLDELAALEDQRRFLLRSLDDLDREHRFGDLDDADYATLHADYTARAAQVLREIEDTRRLDERVAPVHRTWRRVIAALGIAAVAVVAAIVVTSTSGSSNQVGSAPTDELVPSKQTQACIDKMGSMLTSAQDASAQKAFGNAAVDTLRCFSERIASNPDDAVAYTYRGRVLGLLAQQLDGVASKSDVESFTRRADADLAQARRIAPRYPDALAFSAMAAMRRGDLSQARAWLNQIDRLQLPANNPVLPIVNNVLRPALAASASSTTSPGTTVASGPGASAGK